MENGSFLEELKFGMGDGNLHYYLYNWRCPDIKPSKVYHLLPVYLLLCHFLDRPSVTMKNTKICLYIACYYIIYLKYILYYYYLESKEQLKINE